VAATLVSKIEDQRTRTTRIERASLAVLLLAAGALIAGFVMNHGDEESLLWFSDLSLTTVAVGSGLTTLLLTLCMRGRDRLSWFLIGAGTLSWGIGKAIWSYCELVLGMDRPFPSLADAGYVPMIPLMFAGLVTLRGSGERRGGRLSVGLDAFIVMAALATVSWWAVLGPIYAKADAEVAEKVFGLLYPAGDVLLLFALIGGITRGWFARSNPVVAPLMIGIGLFITADLGFAFLTVNDAYQSGNVIDLGWPLGFMFAAYAAAQRLARGEAAMHAPDSEEAPRLERVLRLAPYPLVLGVTVLMFVSRMGARPAESNIFLAIGLLTVLLVVARQFVTLRENEHLTDSLRAFSQRLEVMVDERTARLTALHDLAAALCAASSANEVCTIGLSSLRAAVDGSSAVLYMREGDEWVPTAGHPRLDNVATGPDLNIQAQLLRQDVVVISGQQSRRGTVWVPVTERGQVLGCVAIQGGNVELAGDTRHLATIGAEFGVAFEDQRRFETAYRDEARFRSLVQNSSESITVVDAAGRIRYHSSAARRVFGDDPDRLVGTAWVDLVHPDDAARATAFLAEVAAKPGAIATGEWRRTSHAGWRYVEALATNLLADPNVGGIILNSRDITERKALEDQLTHQAFHDPLTGLANRALFHDRVEHALARSRRKDQPLAVLFLDLDNFKTVNDSLGHTAGDQLLVGIAGRLSACLRAGDTVARLGGDEFAVLLEDLASEDDAAEVAQHIDVALRTPFHLEGKDVLITASIGIAHRGVNSEEATEVLRNADVAMYTAKERGKGRHVTFEPDMHAAVMRRLELEGDMRRAVERGEFLVHYQPLVHLQSGRVMGVEALVRWLHPQHGLISPAEFIPIAEETGLIIPLGRWVLNEACREVRQWQLRYPSESPLTVNVNLSARQLKEAGLVQDVAEALHASGLPAASLALEITESALMHDAEAAVKWLEELSALGVQLAIDDFGTGYSSLSYLRQFPVNTLKIDKSFVDGINHESERATLASAIIELGRSLGLKTVAEGIEEAEQLVELSALGCEVGQGYHFARPMDAEAFESMLAKAAADTAPRPTRRARGQGTARRRTRKAA
jgi:diguanylate cyclase (GGDEF)-like protein/PAS domain S-box-containing protein